MLFPLFLGGRQLAFWVFVLSVFESTISLQVTKVHSERFHVGTEYRLDSFSAVCPEHDSRIRCALKCLTREGCHSFSFRTVAYSSTPERTMTSSSTSDRRVAYSSTPETTTAYSSTPDKTGAYSSTSVTSRSTPGRIVAYSSTPGSTTTYRSTPDSTKPYSTTPDKTWAYSSTPDKTTAYPTSPDKTGAYTTTPERTGAYSSTPARTGIYSTYFENTNMRNKPEMHFNRLPVTRIKPYVVYQVNLRNHSVQTYPHLRGQNIYAYVYIITTQSLLVSVRNGSGCGCILSYPLDNPRSSLVKSNIKCNFMFVPEQSNFVYLAVQKRKKGFVSYMTTNGTGYKVVFESKTFVKSIAVLLKRKVIFISVNHGLKSITLEGKLIKEFGRMGIEGLSVDPMRNVIYYNRRKTVMKMNVASLKRIPVISAPYYLRNLLYYRNHLYIQIPNFRHGLI